ncbi:11833_t:CDS:10 [Funneliformis caledonium]|uniref:11833_t:CDS:1 n=1 Tax=Funneliformis caledonium TaxID=1117310 RepID=A0A9N8VR93_9GLOM|nr:11833_t:CDS:10 [Funneliformis caledonium]
MSRRTNNHKRRRNVTDDNIEVGQEIAVELDSDVFINQTFFLYRCTPFYKFEHTDFTLYGKELHNFITGQMLNTIPSLDHEIREENDFTSEGKVVEIFISKIKLSDWNGTNGMPIGIEIKFKPKGTAKEQIFHIVFLPSIVSRDFINKNSPFSHYPVILIKAPQRLANIAIEWFETRFDCRICRYRLQSSCLKIFIEEWANISFTCDDFIQNLLNTRLIAKPLELTYTIPNISEIKNIKLRMSIVDVKHLYDRLKEQPTESQRIMEGIEKYFFENLRINLSSLALSKIGNNAALIAGEGKLKVESASQLDYEIKQMVERFQEKETEHTWSGFDAALTRLIAITRGKLIEEMAKTLGFKFDALSEIFVPSIIKLCMRTKKTTLIRAQKCVKTIIRECRLPNLIPKFKEALQNQSKTLRNCAAEWIQISLEANEVGDLNNYIADIEWSIRQCASDPSADVRAISKQIFEIYKSKFDLRLDTFVATIKKDPIISKILGIKDKPTKTNALPLIKTLKTRKMNHVREMQSDVIIFTKNGDNVQIINDSEDKVQIIKDKRLPLNNDNSNSSVDKPVITEEPSSLDEPQDAAVALTTSTGFATLKRPKLSSSKSQPVNTTAQRVPAKPTRAQVVNTSSINRDVGTGTGGAQRIRSREHTITITEDKNKASRILNTSKTNNIKPSRPPIIRTTSAPADSPAKKKPSHKFNNIKSKTVPIIGHKSSRETESVSNSVFRPLKVTATATSLTEGLLTTANLTITISTASKQSNRNKIGKPTPTNARLFGRPRERQRQFSPYQKPAIDFATRKFGKKPLPDREELTAKVNALANHAIEVVTRQVEVESSGNLKVEIVAVEEPAIEEQDIENSNTLRARPSIKYQLPATQDITPLPTEPSPPLSFVNPVKFLEDVQKAETNGFTKGENVEQPEVDKSKLQ